MGKQNIDKRLAGELAELLQPRFDGIAVEASHNDRWNRPCVTFRWPGFAGLLPEERFYLLTRAIPESFRESRMGGFVWLELAPGEAVDDFLKQPRSEDMSDREPIIYRELNSMGFFKALDKALGGLGESACGGGFLKSVHVLASNQMTDSRVREVKLVFIRHRAFCDCQVLYTAQPALAELYGAGA